MSRIGKQSKIPTLDRTPSLRDCVNGVVAQERSTRAAELTNAVKTGLVRLNAEETDSIYPREAKPLKNTSPPVKSQVGPWRAADIFASLEWLGHRLCVSVFTTGKEDTIKTVERFVADANVDATVK
eukprot:GHVU01195977.1.p1 GENE.GHVU01195977.1~~GHVU01195977.1.p1  ORF type:complete len:126 (+),score=12.32 GHVU01195977.1:750-1127(+)